MRRLLVVLFLLGICRSAYANPFQVTTLATDSTDSQLVNSWGLTASPTSPFWIGSNGSGVSEVYNGAGAKQSLVVTIPGEGTVTGVAFNTGGGAGAFNGNTFLFASEDGVFSGWRGALGTTAEILQSASDANVYKGMTVGTIGTQTYSYLANFGAGAIDVRKGSVSAPDLTGGFTDPNLPSGYAPFNIENLNGTLYVTYAVKSGDDDAPGAGHGIVDRFDLNGNFLGRVVTGADLNSPWGLALAPSGFDALSGALLVGNFGDGLIHAYNATSNPGNTPIATLLDSSSNAPIMIDGLWALRFSTGAANQGGNPLALYFTAGPDDESGGRFGVITAVPEPTSCVLLASGLLYGIRRRSERPRRA